MTTLLTLCLSLLLAAPAWALSLDYMTTIVEQTAQNVRWDLYFVGTPDVYTVDQYGRQADSFQLWIYETPRADIFNTSDRDGASVLIRGGGDSLGQRDSYSQHPARG